MTMLQERLAAKAKREQMLLHSFQEDEQPAFEEDVGVLEAFSRRPSHVAQHEIMERLLKSPSPSAKSAAELLRQQHPEQTVESRTHSPKAGARASSTHSHRGERPGSELTGLQGTEADYEDLDHHRDSGSDMSDEEGFDSD